MEERVKIGVLAAAFTLAAVGLVVAAIDDAPSACADLRRRLEEIREDLPGKGLEQVSPEELAVLEAALPEQHRLTREIEAKDCR